MNEQRILEVELTDHHGRATTVGRESEGAAVLLVFLRHFG